MTPSMPPRRGSRRDRLTTLLVLGGLLAYAAMVYAIVVLLGGALVGRSSSSPSAALAILATAVIALTFDSVQSRLDDLVVRATHGGRVTPYDVLRQFSESVAGRYAAEELPSRMARVLAQGTGVEWAQVWLAVAGRLTLAATWPPNATRSRPDDPRVGTEAGQRFLEVHHGGDLLGLLVVQEHEQVQLSPVEERLFSGLAGQAGLVLRGASLRRELELRAEELSARARELRDSRQRLVDAQDAERRLLERDIHDGAQQHLVALAVNLRLAQTLAERSPERADTVLSRQEQACVAAMETLAQLTRGIYPTALTNGGLVAALEAAAATSPVPVQVTGSGLGRLPSRVAVAAYYCCLEAMQNAAKHARATTIKIDLRTDVRGTLLLEVADDGIGFDVRTAAPGAGLANMRDRLGALDGTVTLESGSHGTKVLASVPVGSEA